MNFRQLEIFLAVAEKQSFVKASMALFIAQSAVSIAIRKLEDELDLKLFNRNNKRVELTAEGQALLNHAKRIMAQAKDAKLELAEMSALKKGEVKLGVPAMLASYFLPSHLVDFKKQYPNIKITIIDEGTRLIRQHLDQGVIDMGIINLDEPIEDIESHPVIHEEMLLCLSPSHPLAKRRSIKFSELKDQRFILYREGYFLREIVNRMCRKHDLEPRIDFEVNLVHLMKTLVLSDLGISFCLRSVLEEETELVGIPFKPALELNFGIAWKQNSYLSKANQAFADFMISRTSLMST
jgi:DNA-binding transcriptional LysR family regulator